jgi:hypothetical protein
MMQWTIPPNMFLPIGLSVPFGPSRSSAFLKEMSHELATMDSPFLLVLSDPIVADNFVVVATMK